MEELDIDWTDLLCDYCDEPAAHVRLEDVEIGQDALVLAALCDDCMNVGHWVHRHKSRR